ncbi:MAG: M23 family metallopeptidase [Candidatus Woesearchaeota archaeon]|jgi:murein DD-endopeptidase MepM/ murein hydrolase activator NlpD
MKKTLLTLALLGKLAFSSPYFEYNQDVTSFANKKGIPVNLSLPKSQVMKKLDTKKDNVFDKNDANYEHIKKLSENLPHPFQSFVFLSSLYSLGYSLEDVSTYANEMQKDNLFNASKKIFNANNKFKGAKEFVTLFNIAEIVTTNSINPFGFSIIPRESDYVENDDQDYFDNYGTLNSVLRGAQKKTNEKNIQRVFSGLEYITLSSFDASEEFVKTIIGNYNVGYKDSKEKVVNPVKKSDSTAKLDEEEMLMYATDVYDKILKSLSSIDFSFLSISDKPFKNYSNLRLTGNFYETPHLRPNEWGAMTYRRHLGTDYVSPPTSFAPGKVIYKGYKGKAGNTVIVDHGMFKGHHYITSYSHLDDVYVNEGEFVTGGKLLGKMGSSGGFYDPHVHSNVLRDGKPVPLMQYLEK